MLPAYAAVNGGGTCPSCGYTAGCDRSQRLGIAGPGGLKERATSLLPGLPNEQVPKPAAGVYTVWNASGCCIPAEWPRAMRRGAEGHRRQPYRVEGQHACSSAHPSISSAAMPRHERTRIGDPCSQASSRKSIT